MVLEDKSHLHPSEAGRFGGRVRLLQIGDLPSIKPILETWVFG